MVKRTDNIHLTRHADRELAHRKTHCLLWFPLFFSMLSSGYFSWVFHTINRLHLISPKEVDTGILQLASMLFNKRYWWQDSKQVDGWVKLVLLCDPTSKNQNQLHKWLKQTYLTNLCDSLLTFLYWTFFLNEYINPGTSMPCISPC